MAIMKIFGGDNVPLIRNISPQRGTWRVHWGKTTDENEGTYYYGEDFDHKPTLAEIKKVIDTWNNSQTQEKIISGFTWNENSVWLSSENQLNYTMAYNMAIVQADNYEKVTLKFGSDDTPTYYTFETKDELTDFYTKMVAFIQNTLNDGWKVKDAVDYKPYEEALVAE